MKYKYAVSTQNGRPRSKGPGRYVNPNDWKTGPDPIRHDKYYGYLKHNAQARFRKEEYSLTWEQWEELWTDERWAERGRGVDNLCMQQINVGDGWHIDNVEIVTRRQHFDDIKKRNKNVQS